MSPGVAAEGGETGIGHIGRIPVRNIWLLMLYASRLYRVLPMHRRSTVEEEPDQLPGPGRGDTHPRRGTPPAAQSELRVPATGS